MRGGSEERRKEEEWKIKYEGEEGTNLKENSR